jgi:hypothetical protein
MNWLTNSSAVQLWTIGLCIAVTLIGISLAAIFVFLWREPPEEEDPLRQSRVEERLTELAKITTPPSRKSA